MSCHRKHSHLHFPAFLWYKIQSTFPQLKLFLSNLVQPLWKKTKRFASLQPDCEKECKRFQQHNCRKNANHFDNTILRKNWNHFDNPNVRKNAKQFRQHGFRKGCKTFRQHHCRNECKPFGLDDCRKEYKPFQQHKCKKYSNGTCVHAQLHVFQTLKIIYWKKL